MTEAAASAPSCGGTRFHMICLREGQHTSHPAAASASAPETSEEATRQVNTASRIAMLFCWKSQAGKGWACLRIASPSDATAAQKREEKGQEWRCLCKAVTGRSKSTRLAAGRWGR